MCYNCWWKWGSVPVCAGSQCQLGHGESGADFLLLFPSFFSQAVWGHSMLRGQSPFVSILHLLMKQCNCKTHLLSCKHEPMGKTTLAHIWYLWNPLCCHVISVTRKSPGIESKLWAISTPWVSVWMHTEDVLTSVGQDVMGSWVLGIPASVQTDTADTQQGLPSLPNGPGHWDVLESAGMCSCSTEPSNCLLAIATNTTLTHPGGQGPCVSLASVASDLPRFNS